MGDVGGEIWFDVETSGLPLNYQAAYQTRGNWPHIVQLAYMIRDARSGKRTLVSTYVRPSCDVDEGAFEKHGITREFATLYGVSPSTALKTLYEDIVKHDVRTLVAHNIQFDLKVVCNNMFEHCGMDKEARRLSQTFTRVCTMRMLTPIIKLPFKKSSYAKNKRRGRFAKDNFKWPTLAESAAHFDIDITGYNLHDAESDVQVLYEVYKEMKKTASAT